MPGASGAGGEKGGASVGDLMNCITSKAKVSKAKPVSIEVSSTIFVGIFSTHTP